MSNLEFTATFYAGHGVTLKAAIKGDDTAANRIKLRYRLQNMRAAWERKNKMTLPSSLIAPTYSWE